MMKVRIAQHTINENIVTAKILLLHVKKTQSPLSLLSLHDYSRDIFRSSVISVLVLYCTAGYYQVLHYNGGNELESLVDLVEWTSSFLFFENIRIFFLAMKSVPTMFRLHPLF